MPGHTRDCSPKQALLEDMCLDSPARLCSQCLLPVVEWKPELWRDCEPNDIHALFG